MKLLKEIGWYIAGAVVFKIWGLTGMLYTFVKHVLKRDYSLTKHLTPIVRSANLANDGKANAKAGEMMNDWYLIKKIVGLKYGKWDETISEKTGENQIEENLNEDGFVFQRFIDKLLGKNHCKETVINKNK